MHNAPPSYAKARAAIVHPPPDSSLGQAAKTKQASQVPDVTKLPAYIAGDPFLVSAVAHGGYQLRLPPGVTVVGAPAQPHDAAATVR